MKAIQFRSTALVALFVSAVLTASSRNAFAQEEITMNQLKYSDFVSGHDFSHAANAAKSTRAFAPEEGFTGPELSFQQYPDAFTQGQTTNALTQIETNDAVMIVSTTGAVNKTVTTDAPTQVPTPAALTQAATKLVIRNYRSKVDMEKGTEQGWEAVEQQCGTLNDACAAAANAEVTGECAADAQLFSKHSRNWKVLSFALTIASSGFTGLGAATTIAGSTTIPKIFATLGGTTGPGAVASTVNSNVVSDQAGLITINTELSAWLTFLQTGRPNLPAPPTNAQIYQAARTYIALCAAPAMASSGDSDQPIGH